MLRSPRSAIAGLATLAVVGWGLAPTPPAVHAAVDPDAAVVINEVYGGGGNAGAPLSHDFVELYNKGTTAVSLAGWSVQYAPAAATSWTGVIPLSGTIEPGGYFLVQAGTNNAAVGDPLPPPNASGSPNFSASNGNVALVNVATALTCQAAACPTDAAVVDIIGFGSTSTAFAGSPAPSPGNTNSLTRDASQTNTANNGDDFTLLNPPTPTAAPVAPPPDPEKLTIAEIQGTGPASPLVGQPVTTTGVVTAAYPTGGYNGYVIQTEGTGGDADITGRTASDGLYVFSSATVALAEVGDLVTVTGEVTEFQNLTQVVVTDPANFIDLGPSVAPPAPITAPWPTTDAARETIESMLYRPTGDFTVSNTFQANAFGEVGLAFGETPLRTPTDVARPGTPEHAAAVAANASRRVALDDGASTAFLNAANRHLTPTFVSLDDPARVGAGVEFHTDVIVDYRNNLWKFQPLSTVTSDTDHTFATFENTRTGGPDEAALGEGDLKVAAFNVLNYFTTLGVDVAGCSSFNDRDGNPITVNSCPGAGPRGAWNQENLARQQAKIVEAINALDADVVGLIEIENSLVVSGTADAALNELVAALNAHAGVPGMWAAVPSSDQLPAAAEMDVIANAIIYRPATVARVGGSLALGSESTAGGAFDNAREPIGQVFRAAGGGDPFLFVVNHFKSKSSPGPWPGDADIGDGQGFANESRVRQATALRDWVATIQTGAAVDDVFLAGDFNSYTFEDPLQLLYDAGYVNLNEEAGNVRQSYNFGGENGSLDHILANTGAWDRVTGSDVWNVNAPESIALEYSRYNYHGTLLYAPDAYRSSDHDPVVAALTARDPAPDGTTFVTLASINDFHGRIDTNTVKWAATVEQVVASAGGADVAITGAGDLVGASLFDSAVQDDQPTIDVMNAIGLDASAVGNHEFDKGWADLRDRIIGPEGDENAHWDYLGANVYDTDTGEVLLPEYSIITIDGIRVGVIGAVTEETPSLVSPGGMVGVSIGDPVAAVNRVAAQLSDGDDANGEADVLVATFHEGAPAGGQTLEQNMAASATFTEIVEGVSAEVDVLFNGHTHQAYAWDAPIPGGTGTRPVLQTGQYGDNVGKVVLTVDTSTHEVVAYTRENIPRSVAADDALLHEFPQLAEVKQIVDDARAVGAEIGNQPIGRVAADITTAYANGAFGPDGYQADRVDANRDQRNAESTLGGLVANALLETLAPLGVDLPTDAGTIGVVNPGGLRAELFFPTSMPLDEGDGVVTYAEANAVLPFVNNLWTTHLTGAQFKTLLEQQWQTLPDGSVPTRPYLQLGLSDNASYTFDPSLPAGERITSITVDGEPIDPAATYKIATFSFLVTGGDNFRIFTEGTAAADSGLVDRDAWVAYLQDRADPPGIAPDFVRRSAALTPMPTTVLAGGQLDTTLSYLAMTSLGSPLSTSVDVSIDGVELGSVDVSFTPAASGNAAPAVGVSGSAVVNLAVPTSVPAGPATLTFVVQPTGQVIEVPITVEGTGSAAPVISVPAAGSTTRDTTPVISGTSEPGTTVTVSEGSVVLGTATASSTGEWSLTSVRLGQGAHTIVAVASGEGGTSDPSAPVTFTVDSVAPARPVITSPGQLSVVRALVVPVRGRAEAGASVALSVNGVEVGSATADGAGTWALSTPKLQTGLYILTARATDAAGNRSVVSIPVIFAACDPKGPSGRFDLVYLLLCR